MEKLKKVKDKIVTAFKDGYKPLLCYWAFFAVSILFCEIMIRFVVNGKIVGDNFLMLFFIPAESLFLALLCGIWRPVVTRILFPLLNFALAFFYVGQTIYYRNFKSLFSLSVAGMGRAAVGSFWWAVKDTIIHAMVFILLMLVPLVISIVVSIRNKPVLKPYSWIVHIAVAIAVVILWLGGLAGLKVVSPSAHRQFYKPIFDIDTGAQRVGTLTASLRECATYFFGFGGDGEIIPDNNEALHIEDKRKPEEEVQPSDVSVSVSDNSVSDNTVVEVEEVVREPWIYEEIDFNKLAEVAEKDDVKKLCEYFASREATTTNEYTGMFEGYNLIYICAESFWTYACNEEACPTLYKMANNGIVLRNYYNSFKNTTTNGEYAFATALWPNVTCIANNGTDIGNFAQSASRYMPQGLGDLAKEIGVNTLAFHNYYGKYYRRILSWPNLGYECSFMGQGMTFTTSWPASDLEMIEQSVDKYINEDQFFAYYMTFSGHGPYTARNCIYNKNIDAVKALVSDKDMDDNALGYLAGEYELDKAMELLLKRLEEAGKLDNTVIVIAGDHYPYYLSTDGRDALVGHEMDETFDIYKSTCIIYNAGMEEPLNVDTYCCNVDILPTILNLFNVPFDSRLFMGNDIFSDGIHKATIYNLSFVSDLCKYNSATEEVEWSEDALKYYDQEDLDAYLDAMVKHLESEYLASNEIIDENFFKFVWYNSGLMTDEELAIEEAREKAVVEEDDEYNVEDAEAKARREAEKAAKEAAEREAEAANSPSNNTVSNPDVEPVVVPTTPDTIVE